MDSRCDSPGCRRAHWGYTVEGPAEKFKKYFKVLGLKSKIYKKHFVYIIFCGRGVYGGWG